ncbi:YbaB/EbfC family nucleoid-associated protein [Nocardia amamiensis]|uniref:YbaB/EbfC family nucleoid-associated protein n=1 Tax=Nocardia amamiensis TaxID=404578 RepID=A0ABS0CUJ9_9NOCA|nr:YbaB/EbfC family nucleoid-associated protein [Nocardia amamiensis]MBF6300262.1 YbaB/EbfC family nucleoid-associated protein [Nocardia amamiensis]
MQDSGRDATQPSTDALRDQVDSLREVFEQQRRDLAEAQSTLASTTVTAWSSNNLIRVVSNAAGVPVEVHVDPEAFKRSTPEKLGQSITEAVQAAARLAVEATQQAVAPLEASAGEIPDLSDLVPGAPSIRDLVRTMFPEPSAAQDETAPLDEESEDEYYRNRSYLRDRP